MLVGYWKFDEGTGLIAYDSSGNAYNGDIINATFSPGIKNTGLSFNGLNSYVNMGINPAFNIYNQLTLLAWVKTTDASTNDNTIVARASVQYIHTWSLEVYLGKAYFWFANGYGFGAGDRATGVKTVNDGNWHHLAGVADGSSIKIYVDGVLEESKLKTTFPTSDTTLRTTIGWMSGASSAYFNGIIDEVKVYNHPLTAADVLADYNTVQPPTQCPTLINATLAIT